MSARRAKAASNLLPLAASGRRSRSTTDWKLSNRRLGILSAAGSSKYQGFGADVYRRAGPTAGRPAPPTVKGGHLVPRTCGIGKENLNEYRLLRSLNIPAPSEFERPRPYRLRCRCR